MHTLCPLLYKLDKPRCTQISKTLQVITTVTEVGHDTEKVHIIKSTPVPTPQEQTSDLTRNHIRVKINLKKGSVSLHFMADFDKIQYMRSPCKNVEKI